MASTSHTTKNKWCATLLGPTKGACLLLAALAAGPAPAQVQANGATPLIVPQTNFGALEVTPGENELEHGFVPRVELSETYVDNVTLAARGQSTRADWVTQIIPGFRYTTDHERFTANIDYGLQAIEYARHHDYDETYNHLAAAARGTLVSDLLYLQANANASQGLVNPALQQGGIDNILGTAGNLTNIYSGSVTPFLQRAFADMQVYIRYTDGVVHYNRIDEPNSQAFIASTPLANSHSQEGYASWGTDDKSTDAVRWNLSFDRSHVAYDEAQPFDTQRAQASLGWRITQSFELMAQGGKESEVQLGLIDGQLKSTFWMGGFDYKFGKDGELRALAGHRFFGRTYDGKFHYGGRWLVLNATYVEGPTTTAAELALTPTGAYGITGPAAHGNYLLGITDLAFVRKYFDAGLTLKGRATDVEVRVGNYRVFYVSTPVNDSRSFQGSAALIRRLSERSSLRFSYGSTEFDFVDQPVLPGHENVGRLEYLRQISREMVGSIAVGHLQQSGSGTDYAVNYGMIRLGAKF